MLRVSLLLSLCFFTQNLSAQFAATAQIIDRSADADLLSVEATDVDGDGSPDALCTFPNLVVWMKNGGAASFWPDRELLEVNLSVTVGFNPARFRDIDADGLPDLACGVFWRKGLGNGAFAAPEEVFENTLAGFCDVNSDGLPDAIVLSSTKIYYQKNLGSGQFAGLQLIADNPQNGRFLAAADLDHDGREDFVTTDNYFLRWRRNLGNGSFATHILLPSAKSAAVGDVDKNGRTDLLAGISGKIEWLEFDSLGAWQLRQTVTTNYLSGQIALNDLDLDGDADLFVGHTSNVLSAGAWFATFDSTGLFSPLKKYGNTGYDLLSLADLNGNGLPDLLAARVFGSLEILPVKNPYDPVPIASVNMFRPMLAAQQIIAEDFDGDGDDDLLAASFFYEKTAPGTLAQRKPAGLPASDVRFADLDGDGLKDAVYPFVNKIAWQKNLDSLRFATRIVLPTYFALLQDAGLGDLDGDGDTDLFAACGTESVPANEILAWLENDGAGNFTEHLLDTDVAYCLATFALDANDDGRLDLVFLLGNGDPDRIYLNLGGGNFAPAQPLFEPATTEPVRLNEWRSADLDGDGRLDMVFSTRDFSLTEVFWHRNLGNGQFGEKQMLVQANQNASAGGLFFAIFDADGDSNLDLAVSDRYNSRLFFVRNLGSGTFAPAQQIFQTLDIFGGHFALAPFDVDDDGRLDLVFSHELPPGGSLNQLSWLAGMETSSLPVAEAEELGFQVFPNPLAAGQPLQILLENDFFGTVKIEILSLDGRVLQTFLVEKTTHGVTWSGPVTIAPASFFVRVSNGKTAAVRLVSGF